MPGISLVAKPADVVAWREDERRSTKNLRFCETSLRARWHRWLKTNDGRIVCQRWQTWIAEMVRKYEWEIDPDDASYPTIHGLRGAGILVRRAAGYDVDQIANDIGMSRQMVERYMRFRDQMEIAAAGKRDSASSPTAERD